MAGGLMNGARPQDGLPPGGNAEKGTSPDDVFRDFLALMRESPFHRTWSKSDIGRLIVPPIKLNQYYLLHDDNDGKPDGFITWAFLTPEAAKGYVDRTRKIQPGDWNAGGDLWVIDFVAPHGNADSMRRQFQEMAQRDGLPLPAKYVRTAKGRREVMTTDAPDGQTP